MDKILISKLYILEAAFKTIKDSLEWGGGCEDNSHTMFVDGIVSMTETLLDGFNEPEHPKEDE